LKKLLCIFLGLICFANANETFGKEPENSYKSSVLTTYLTFANVGEEKTNTHHIELQYRYQLAKNDVVGIKFATWKLFAPMGIQLWDSQFLNEDEFYNGRLRETGIGVAYQRFFWKGMYTSIEMLPLFKTYLDENDEEIDDGFKLYTTFHLGYHFTFLKNRLFVEPQFHCNYWPIDTKGPKEFEDFDSKWSNYFLFEPNLYLGVNF